MVDLNCIRALFGLFIADVTVYLCYCWSYTAVISTVSPSLLVLFKTDPLSTKEFVDYRVLHEVEICNAVFILLLVK